jgi:hypothetical protein
MFNNQFAALCEKYGIHPVIALEDGEVWLAYTARNLEHAELALKNNF